MPSIKRRAENDINDTASVKRRHISRPEESKQNENKMNMEGRAASSATSPTLVNSGRDEENIQVIYALHLVLHLVYTDLIFGIESQSNTK